MTVATTRSSAIVVGSRDTFLPEAMLRDERARLDQSGVPYTFVPFAGGHRLDDATLAHLLTPG